MYQTTVARRVEVCGIGFHLAQLCRMAICPAPANTGIVFERTDFDHFRIPARTQYVAHVAYSTGLVRNGVMVCTVEHLMSALFGCHVDNAIIELDSVEVPIFDGSARQFVEMIQSAGLIELDSPRRFIRVRKPISVALADREVTLAPAGSDLEIECTIDFDHPLIKRQQLSMVCENGTFRDAIGDARTFIFFDEFTWRRRCGQVRGGSTTTAVVLTRNALLNSDGLRYRDEFVRHKTLDLMGDLALLGYPLIAKVTAMRSGHALHNDVAAKLMADTSAWELVTARQL